MPITYVFVCRDEHHRNAYTCTLELQATLSETLPNLIAVNWQPEGGKNLLDAAVGDIARRTSTSARSELSESSWRSTDSLPSSPRSDHSGAGAGSSQSSLQDQLLHHLRRIRSRQALQDHVRSIRTRTHSDQLPDIARGVELVSRWHRFLSTSRNPISYASEHTGGIGDARDAGWSNI